MKSYAIIKVVNGSYSIQAEGFTTPEQAKVNYFQTCATLWNSDDVKTACIMITDETFNIVDSCREIINKVTFEIDCELTGTQS